MPLNILSIPSTLVPLYTCDNSEHFGSIDITIVFIGLFVLAEVDKYL